MPACTRSGRDLVEDVRLYGEDDEVGAVRNREVALERLAADLLGQRLALLGIRIGEEHRVRGAGLAARGRPATGSPPAMFPAPTKPTLMVGTLFGGADAPPVASSRPASAIHQRT